jgi:translocation and assembly module TamA
MKRIQLSIIVTAILLVWLATPVCWAANITLRTQIAGINADLLNNVKSRLAVIQASYGPTLTPEQAQDFYKNAPKNIQDALQPFGYFKATVYPTLFRQGTVWTADFVVDTGPPLRITQLNLQITGPGQDDPELQQLAQHFPISVGQVFQAESYDKAKQALFQTANNQGYLKAVLEKKEILIDLKSDTAVITLTLNTGPRYYFGPITFTQHTFAFSEEFLRRFMTFHEGDPFSSQKLLKSQENLNNSHYFHQVLVTPEMNQSSDQQIPTDVGLTATKSQEYNIGGGYGTFTGPRLTFGAKMRHLTDTGHYLNLQMKLSSVLSGLDAQYVIPGQNPLTDQYTIGANAQKFKPKNGNSISKTLYVSHVKNIGYDWKRTVMLSYLRESYRIDTNANPTSHNSRLLIPSLSFSRMKSDNLLNPRFGQKIDFVIRGSSQAAVSNTNFIQSEIKGVYLFSPTELSTVVLRGDFGYTDVKDLTKLPLTLQFFAGGLNSIRGFPYSYFGPGRYLKVGSIELRHRIIDQWSGAVFYDLGTADNHINAAMGHGRGVGVIYDSLIGPIKAYVGFGKLQSKPRHFDFEFSLGPDL